MRPNLNPRPQSTAPHVRQQRGIVLIVVLVMLVIIGMASAGVMRGALSSDRISHNVRLQVSAQEASQVALRYCENLARNVDPITGTTVANGQPFALLQPPAAAGMNWEAFPSWFGAGVLATTVPLAAMQSANNAREVPGQRPQCLAECRNMTTPDGVASVATTPNCTGANEAIVVTSRGFSTDYTEDANGRSTSGSAIWLQSTFR